MPDMPPEIWAIIIVGMIVWTAGQSIVHEAGVVARKAKCGIIHVVGKHCEPPVEEER